MTRLSRLVSVLLMTGVLSCHRHFSGGGGGPPTLNVLFIGDSYTSTNDLPGTFSALAQAAGVESVTVDSVTVDGAQLEALWTGSDAPMRIAAGGWSHIVIQGQSEEPCLDPTDFQPYAAKFAKAAEAVQAQAVFLETWPRQAGNSLYSESWTGGTPAAMLACLKSGYSQAAQANGAVVAPVGDAWFAATEMQPDIDLYQSDGSHPTPDGTFLAASVLLDTLAHTSPEGVAVAVAGVSDNEASALESIAAGTE